MNNGMDWENIKYFIALAKAKRLEGAAKLLKSNHSTVYRRIKAFEEDIGTKLFQSTPAGHQLTSAGENLFKSVEGLDNRMEEVGRRIAGLDDTVYGNIVVTTTYSLASTVIPKLFSDFKKKWPMLTIDLRVSNQFHNLSKREADIAIRPSSVVPEHLIGRKLGQINFGVFASKKYIQKNPSKDFLKNISSHEFVCLDESLSHLKSKQWIDKKLSPDSRVYRVDNITAMAHLCSEGVGVSVLPTYFADTFKNLSLIHNPEEFIGSDLWLLTHKAISKTPKIRTAMDFFASELRSNFRN